MLKTLKIHESTHRKLEQHGMKGDTFDDIINKLIKEVDNARS